MKMDDLGILQPPLFQDNIFVQNVARTIDLYLSGEIKEPSEYVKWLNIINTASENDCIFIHINSPGGMLDTAIQLRESLLNCPAHTVASVEGECCSGATFILLSCKETRLSKSSRFMVHSASWGLAGKTHEIYSSIDFDKKWFKDIFMDIYKGFLTDDELEKVLSGSDLWMNSDEVYERLIEYKKRFEQEDKPAAKPEKKKVKVVNKKKEKK